MTAVLESFAAAHHRGELEITIVNDGWSENLSTIAAGAGAGAGAGAASARSNCTWEGYTIVLAVNGVLFEVQVVLRQMFLARQERTASPKHAEARCLAGMLRLLGV